MKLFLMRHAKTQPSVDDPKRPLTAYGYEQIKTVLSRVPGDVRDIKHIFRSDTLRTKQTAQVVIESLNLSIAPVVSPCMGELSDIGDCLSDIAAWESDTLIVSHMPFLTQLLNALVVCDQVHAPIVQFATATMVCLEKSALDQWVIRWVMVPS